MCEKSLTTDLNNLPAKCYDEAIQILQNLKKEKPKNVTNLILLFNGIDKVFLNSKEYFELLFFNDTWFGYSIDDEGEDFFVFLNEVSFKVNNIIGNAEDAYKLHRIAKDFNTELGKLLCNTEYNYFDNPFEYYYSLIEIAVNYWKPVDTNHFRDILSKV